MKLELCRFKVRKTEFGDSTRLQQGTLYLNKEEMIRFINRDRLFESVDVEIARPGESLRIVHIMDAVEPRLKIVGGTSAFPGLLGRMEIAGNGRTNVLDGVAVLQTGQWQGVQEGIIDMSGPGANFSIFSRTINVVLLCNPLPGANNVEFDHATRIAALEAAEYLAGVTRDIVPDEVEEYEIVPGAASIGSLPRVAYIYHLQSQGVLRDTFVYGENARSLLPTVLHPNEIMDGAIVSSNYIIACQKNPTYLHLNNPVVRELYRRHGKDLYFAGVIVANEHSTLREKERSAKFAAKLAAQLGTQGVIITQEGGGHADTDLMLNCLECEKLGIKTVILANEIAGINGDLPSLVDTVTEADAVVSTGNNDEVVTLPPVKRVIGGSEVTGVSAKPEDGFTIALSRIYTATNQLGATLLTVKEH